MSSSTFSWLIGSDRASDVVIRGSSVSRRHCRLRLTQDGFRLEDLGSTNRTYVNGKPISGEARVTKCDKITLGQNVPMPWPILNLPHRTFNIGRTADND